MEIVGMSSEHMRRSDQVSLDINDLVEIVRADLKILHSFSDKCCIYRVPKRLRDLNEKAYTPRVVSIGPLHHGKDHQNSMEEHKKMYLQEFLIKSKVSVEHYIKVIKQNESRLRNCYAETIELCSKDFVKMILIDAAFVVMVFLKNYGKGFESEVNDRIFNKPWMIVDVMLDICLLENQLPFFILDDLFKLSNIAKNVDGELSMIKLTHDFLKKKWSSWVTTEAMGKLNSSAVEHFVDFLRICQEPSDQPSNEQKELKTATRPTATDLYQAGVKLKQVSSNNIFDIKFKNGILEIPALKVFDETEMFFRNLQAYEQCHCLESYYSDYIALMNSLVNAPKDVELLIGKGILENWASDTSRVATLFHNLATENIVFYDNFYWSSLVASLNGYCSSPRHKWKAILKQNYFHHPWSTLSVVAAAILLLLTFIQTVCSILQV